MLKIILRPYICNVTVLFQITSSVLDYLHSVVLINFFVIYIIFKRLTLR